jgi:hypothetical protein
MSDWYYGPKEKRKIGNGTKGFICMFIALSMFISNLFIPSPFRYIPVFIGWGLLILELYFFGIFKRIKEE